MKKILFLFTIVISSLGCKKNPTHSRDQVNATITINGSNYSVLQDEYSSIVEKFTVPIFGGDYIGVTGWTSLNSKLNITLPTDISTGVHNIGSSGLYTALYYDGATQISYSSADGSGTISIESVTSNHIKGTFHFNCYNNTQVATVTDGNFEGDL